MREALSEQLAAQATALGRTPMRRLDLSGAEVWCKLESRNPFSRSAKDRSAFAMLHAAALRSDLTAESVVVESSSGNLAIALALMCSGVDLEFVPVIDAACNKSVEARLRLLCAHVVKIADRDVDRRVATARELAEGIPRGFWPNQYANLDAAMAHYESTAGEIREDLRRLDAAFVGVGTGGTIAGVSRRLKQEFPGVHVVAVDVEGSSIFGGPSAVRHIPGMGSALRPPLVDLAEIDEVVLISEAECVTGCYELVNEHGVLAGGSTGGVYAAVRRWIDTSDLGRPPTLLFLAGDSGVPYLETVYDQDWVLARYGDLALPSLDLGSLDHAELGLAPLPTGTP